MKKIWLIGGFLCSVWAIAQSDLDLQIAEVTAKAMEQFDVPGIAVAVVHEGKVVHAQGYGLRSIENQQAVDQHTLFGIASNSKAFTAAALAILIDRGLLQWDDKVRDYLPEFKMYNDYVTQEFTIRDLLTHRSGLGLGAGDLMIWPDGHNFTPQDIVNHIQYLPPVSGFRAQYDYDNLLYVIAGVVIERISGKTWAAFVEDEIMAPLGMTQSAGNWNRVKNKENAIVPHVAIDGKLQVIDRYTHTILDAAAGIYSNIDDMAKWMQMQLDQGAYATDQQLFSTERHREMWTPQTLIPARTTSPYFSIFNSYGLGWQITDVLGKKQVSHTGGLEGIVTQVTLLPQLKLGIVVLTNQQSGEAFHAIANTIKNYYLQLPYQDFVSAYKSKSNAENKQADRITEAVWQQVERNLQQGVHSKWEDALLGNFDDPWFGTILIDKRGDQLYFTSLRSPQLSGELFYYEDSRFVVKWNNRYFNADAFLEVHPRHQNIDSLTMRAISPQTDFSYDFHDLKFTREKTNKAQ